MRKQREDKNEEETKGKISVRIRKGKLGSLNWTEGCSKNKSKAKVQYLSPLSTLSPWKRDWEWRGGGEKVKG